MNQTPPQTAVKNNPPRPRTWEELRHPVTNALIAKYCHETNQLEVIDRGKRGIITLAKQ